MKKLHVNFMKDLRNHEFVELYNLIINYIETQQVDDAHITTAFERVKSHQNKLQYMQKRKRSSFSIENKELTRHRNDYLISLRSEEHTSELQSRPHLVCRLLLDKNNRPFQ